MKARNFPSYRLRHAIRVWRYRRKYPWQFPKAQQAEPDKGDVVRLPPSEEFDHSPDP